MPSSRSAAVQNSIESGIRSDPNLGRCLPQASQPSQASSPPTEVKVKLMGFLAETTSRFVHSSSQLVLTKHSVKSININNIIYIYIPIYIANVSTPTRSYECYHHDSTMSLLPSTSNPPFCSILIASGNYHSASSWPSSPAMAGPPFPFARPSTRALSHVSLFHVSLGKVISSNYEFYRFKSNETHECQTLRFPSAANPAHWH